MILPNISTYMVSSGWQSLLSPSRTRAWISRKRYQRLYRQDQHVHILRINGFNGGLVSGLREPPKESDLSNGSVSC